MATLEDLPQEARDELAMLARELSDDPTTRRKFLALAREKRPNMPMPELDIDDRMAAIQSEADKRVAALEAKISDKDMREELQRRRDNLIATGKAKDAADVEAIEKIMLEKGIQNHESAAEYFNWMQQAAVPTAPAYNRNVIDPNTRVQLKDYWKNPIMAARDEAQRAFTDYRKNPKIAG